MAPSEPARVTGELESRTTGGLGTPSVQLAPWLVRGGLYLPEADYRYLFASLGPSLGLWRAAEVAALRAQLPRLEPPVLDLGCGDGLVTSLVLPHVAIGLDPDVSALGVARSRGIYGRLEPWAVQDATLPAGSIGTVISNSVLEHVPAIDEALTATARLLRPGGRLLFTVPTEGFGRQLALPFERYAVWRNSKLVHLNLWSLGRWHARLARAGLEIEEVQPYLRHGLVVAWDGLELLQQIWIGRRRLFGLVWRRLPAPLISALARRAAQVDLAAPAPGGGRLIVARKRKVMTGWW